MQIVIDIPDRIYKINQNRTLNITDAEILEKAVRNGTPLPKGHGRLIDGDRLAKEIFVIGIYSEKSVKKQIRDADAIIEADKEESEDVI